MELIIENKLLAKHLEFEALVYRTYLNKNDILDPNAQKGFVSGVFEHISTILCP